MPSPHLAACPARSGSQNRAGAGPIRTDNSTTVCRRHATLPAELFGPIALTNDVRSIPVTLAGEHDSLGVNNTGFKIGLDETEERPPHADSGHLRAAHRKQRRLAPVDPRRAHGPQLSPGD